jgi:cytoskeletal protein CcmA (bactofilin family)
MWKRSDSEELPEPRAAPVEPTLKPRPTREAATIGPSISIHGDVSGDEDLIVQGHVEGTVTLQKHSVTVGKEGRIKANVRAKSIEVEGQVEGDLHGEEQVVVRRSGNIRGNVVSPRVTLEDGCRFKGSIDMDVETKPSEKIAGIKPAPQPEEPYRSEKRGAQWKAESKASGS